MAGGADVSLSDSKTELQDIISSGGDIIEKCSVKLREIEGRRNEIIREIDNKKMEMIKMFDDAKSRVEGELNAYDESDVQRLNGVKHDAEDLQINVQKLLTLTEHVDKNGTDAEKFILNFECKNKKQHAVNKRDELMTNDYIKGLNLEWYNHILKSLNTVDPIATLQESSPSLDTDIYDTTETSHCLNIHDESVIASDIGAVNTTDSPIPQDTVNNAGHFQDYHSTPSRPVRLTPIATLNLVKTDGDKDYPFVTGMCFLKDGRIVAVDSMNKKCFVMDASLVRQGSGFRLKRQPHDVTCMQNDMLAVTHG